MESCGEGCASLTHSCRCLNSSPSLPGPELEREFKSFLRDSASSSQQCQEAQRDLMRAFQAAQESTMTVSGEGGREGQMCVTLRVQGNLESLDTAFSLVLMIVCSLPYTFVLFVVKFVTLVTPCCIASLDSNTAYFHATVHGDSPLPYINIILLPLWHIGAL